MELKYDKPLTAMVLSILGALPAGIFSEIIKSFHLTTITFSEATSMMYIKEGSTVLGILSYIGYSAVLGLILYYSPKILGIDYYIIKAIFICMVAESILFILFGNLANNKFMMQDAVGNYMMAIAAALGGLGRGYLIKRYLFTERILHSED